MAGKTNRGQRSDAKYSSRTVAGQSSSRTGRSDAEGSRDCKWYVALMVSDLLPISLEVVRSSLVNSPPQPSGKQLKICQYLVSTSLGSPFSSLGLYRHLLTAFAARSHRNTRGYERHSESGLRTWKTYCPGDTEERSTAASIDVRPLAVTTLGTTA